MSDVISDASLRLAGNSSLQKKMPFIKAIHLGLLFAILFALLLLGGCAGSDGSKDDTDIWSESKLYSEATDKLNDADFAKCGKYFEKLEARFPFGPYSQQAQINAAYCYWKAQEQAQAWHWPGSPGPASRFDYYHCSLGKSFNEGFELGQGSGFGHRCGRGRDRRSSSGPLAIGEGLLQPLR